MKELFIAEMVENQAVDSTFLVVEKRLAETRSGVPYLRLRLSDRTGEIEGRVWEQAFELGKEFEKDDFVRSKGRVTRYQDTLQIVIHHIEKLPESTVDPSDFLPASTRDVEAMWEELKTFARGVGHRSLRDLLDAFLTDPEFSARFRRAPAAKRLHHVYIGGLLEHTVNICRLVQAVCEIYTPLNRDVLMAGAILHDMGKIEELTYEKSFNYSDQGRLLGHLIMGFEMVERKIAVLKDFPQELALILKHLMISHHGQYIWGSPKRPKTLEAVVLHYLDDMDAKYNAVREFLEKSMRVDSRWTEHHQVFDQFFYQPDLEESDT
jgi:3'-5' exoribonuclease